MMDLLLLKLEIETVGVNEEDSFLEVESRTRGVWVMVILPVLFRLDAISSDFVKLMFLLCLGANLLIESEIPNFFGPSPSKSTVNAIGEIFFLSTLALVSLALSILMLLSELMLSGPVSAAGRQSVIITIRKAF